MTPPNSTKRTTGTTSFWASRAAWFLIAFLVICGLLLAFEHRVHLLTGTVGLAVLLGICVIMLVVLWRSHGSAPSSKGGQS